MKDHEISMLVNDLTKIARDYARTEQLRERISMRLAPALKQSSPPPASAQGMTDEQIDAVQPAEGAEPECERLTGHDWSMNADGSFACVRCGLFCPKASHPADKDGARSVLDAFDQYGRSLGVGHKVEPKHFPKSWLWFEAGWNAAMSTGTQKGE